jgi:hypothetical protein
MSRKKPILDYVLIERLANLGCPDYEIAYAIRYTPAHFNKLKKKDELIRDAIDRGSNGIKVSLRRATLRVAMPSDEFLTNPNNSDAYSGNMTGLIWLSKQYLHQSDHVKISNDGDAPFVVENRVNVGDIDAKIERYIQQRKAKAVGKTDG